MSDEARKKTGKNGQGNCSAQEDEYLSGHCDSGLSHLIKCLYPQIHCYTGFENLMYKDLAIGTPGSILLRRGHKAQNL
jgi:hypothetical protein